MFTLTEMLCDLEDEAGLAVLHLEGVEDGRQLAIELHVHHGTDDGRDLTGRVAGSGGRRGGGRSIVSPTCGRHTGVRQSTGQAVT